jgi:hypothetical protein
MPSRDGRGSFASSARLFVVPSTDQDQVVLVQRGFRVDDGFRSVMDFAPAAAGSVSVDTVDVAGTDAITNTSPGCAVHQACVSRIADSLAGSFAGSSAFGMTASDRLGNVDQLAASPADGRDRTHDFTASNRTRSH